MTATLNLTTELHHAQVKHSVPIPEGAWVEARTEGNGLMMIVVYREGSDPQGFGPAPALAGFSRVSSFSVDPSGT
ncbi:hypothetical protein [Streptomyces hydrogenans]|uniref:hypothetical protein n=1 Tax=Streptomyces hydrogenans TaxID=1873719 RepID=UPI0035DDEABF